MFHFLHHFKLKGNNLVDGPVRAGTGWRDILPGITHEYRTTTVTVYTCHVIHIWLIAIDVQSIENMHVALAVSKRSTRAWAK